MTNRRRTDANRRSGGDRRILADRRHYAANGSRYFRYPSWSEQMVQFLTRYLFVLFGLLFFNFTQGIEPTSWSTAQLNLAFAVYTILTTAAFFHASRQHICPPRYRIAMWFDIVITSICLLNDPYDIPPSLLVFIMVVLGNGMRYGMRMFGEALISCFAAIMLVFSLRFTTMGEALSPGMLFLNLFGGVILVYAYILMGRIEMSRNQLEEKSRLDTLTGLMNRRGLQEEATHLFDKLVPGNHRIVVMFADLDKFKDINDTYGHAMGDEILQRFSNILRSNIRSSDIAARLGGDEFVLILCDTTLDEAHIAAERIQSHIRSCAAEHAMTCSATIGMGEAPTHGTTLDEILDRVDEAMYRSKQSNNRGSIQRVDILPQTA